jgi:hypothetical protein
MRLVRLASVAALGAALGSLVFSSGHFALGQDNAPGAQPAPGLPDLPRMTYVPVQMHNGPDPEVGKLQHEEAKFDQEAAGLLREFARTENNDQRDKLKTRLADILAKEFDLQQKRRELELTRLETHMKKLRDMMNKRGAARQTIVEKRLDQLLRDADGLGWNSPSKSAPFPYVGAPDLKSFPQLQVR